MPYSSPPQAMYVTLSYSSSINCFKHSTCYFKHTTYYFKHSTG